MLVDSKSILAKLLAKENINVEHQKVKTAAFDLKSRTLICPVWAEMSSDLYDLLLAHEVGHALNTPAQGWHDAVTENDKGFRSYLNVVEDARIERKIKDLYPGLKSSFYKAYEELSEREFFGPLDPEDLEFMPLIDRINMHFKLGSLANIKFSNEEKVLVQKVSSTETWEDVEKVSKELYEYGKKEISKLREMLDELMSSLEDDNVEIEYNQENDFDGMDSDYSKECDTETTESLRRILDKANPFGDDDIRSTTDSYFREKESDLLDSTAKPYYYVNVPVPNLNQTVVPYKKVKNSFKFKAVSYSGEDDDRRIELANKFRDKLYLKFLQTNKKYISYLIKEFELRRNAQQFARAKVAKSGEIDIKKVYSYKFNEDIFKRITTIPGGKNHGLVMVIDFSGSMTDSILGTIEQTLLLAIFCRKINIPFKVLSFTDRIDTIVNYDKEFKQKDNSLLDYTKFFSADEKDLHMPVHTAKLVEYINNELSGTEFTEACKNFLFLGNALSRNNNYRMYKLNEDEPSVTYSFEHTLGGTPLNEAIVIATELVRKFKTDYKLDIVNTIFLTDGMGHDIYYYTTGNFHKSNSHPIIPETCELGHNIEKSNVLITHKETKAKGHKFPGQPITTGLLEMFRNVTGSNVIGFYLIGNATPSQIYSYGKHYGKYFSDTETKSASMSIRKLKFATIKIHGYDKFFLMPNGKNLEVGEEEIEAKAGASKNDIKKAFLKLQKNKLANRVFLNKFIEEIA
jgi:polyhydroxyalkanoate synthesis regulator phasin